MNPESCTKHLSLRLFAFVTATQLLTGALGDITTNKETASAVESISPEIRALQQEFLAWRFGLFIHFNLGTFANKDWANGYEDPALFSPSRLDCDEWAKAAKTAGMKYGILTVKHTEGYALWDSAVTTHDITAFSNFKKGKGDLVREFVQAFRSRGLKVGLYYCFPGDYSKNSLTAGQPDLHGLAPEAASDQINFIKAQLTELLTRYGPIDLLWIDQYDNKYTAARWSEFLTLAKSLQPHCLVLGNNANNFKNTDILSHEFPWKHELPPEGNTAPSEVCDTIQPNQRWFWNKNLKAQDLQGASEIVRKLRLCNERCCNYLLNVPPDTNGLISGPYLERLQEVGRLLKQK